MDAGAEGEMLARPRTVDAEGLGVVDRCFVAVARDVPHDDLVAFPDGFPGKLGIAGRGAAHVDYRRLVADQLGHEGRDQRQIAAQLFLLAGIFRQRYQPAGH